MSGAEHAGDRLSAYLDGELSAADFAAVDDHLAACPACRLELDGTRQVRGLVRRLPPPELPAGLVERVLMRPRQRVLPLAWVASAAAAVALGFVATGTTAQPRQPPSVERLVQAHATSTGGDPVSGLAPAALPVALSR